MMLIEFSLWCKREGKKNPRNKAVAHYPSFSRKSYTTKETLCSLFMPNIDLLHISWEFCNI